MAAFFHGAAHRYVFPFAMAALAFGAAVPLVQLSWKFPRNKSLGVVDAITKTRATWPTKAIAQIARGFWDHDLRAQGHRAKRLAEASGRMSFFHVSPMSAQHPDHNFHFSVEPRSGDVLILIGFADMFTFFRKCKNVSMLVAFLCFSCIYYNSEPRRTKGEMHKRYDMWCVCEVWDYTRAKWTHRSSGAPCASRFFSSGGHPRGNGSNCFWNWTWQNWNLSLVPWRQSVGLVGSICKQFDILLPLKTCIFLDRLVKLGRIPSRVFEHSQPMQSQLCTGRLGNSGLIPTKCRI